MKNINSEELKISLTQQEIDYLLSCMMDSEMKPCQMSSELYEKLIKVKKLK